MEQGVVVGLLDFFLADQQTEIDVAERGDEGEDGHMQHQILVKLGIEQPDAEAHHYGNHARPNHGGHQYLLERMAWGEVDDAGTTDNLGEDEDEGDGGQHQRLCSRAGIAQGLGDDNGDEEVERCRQNLRSKGI